MLANFHVILGIDESSKVQKDKIVLQLIVIGLYFSFGTRDAEALIISANRQRDGKFLHCGVKEQTCDVWIIVLIATSIFSGRV
jgi:hypothetical protein